MNIPDGFEAMTKDEYDRKIAEDEIFAESRKTYLSDKRKEEIGTTNALAHHNAIVKLIDNHRYEYEKYVVAERKDLGIDHLVRSEWANKIKSLKVADD